MQQTSVKDTGQQRLDVLEAIFRGRFSCRAFVGVPVDRATIERVLEVAGRAASWSNTQSWDVIVTGGEETEKFKSLMFEAASGGEHGQSDFVFPSGYSGARLDRRRQVGFQLYNSLGIARGDRDGYARQARENFRFFGAPHVAIVTTADELGTYGAVDCGCYVMAFLLAAEAAGLAAIAQAALATRSDLIRRHFRLDDNRRVVCGISFGYPDLKHPANAFRAPRAQLSETVTFLGL